MKDNKKEEISMFILGYADDGKEIKEAVSAFNEVSYAKTEKELERATDKAEDAIRRIKEVYIEYSAKLHQLYGIKRRELDKKKGARK